VLYVDGISRVALTGSQSAVGTNDLTIGVSGFIDSFMFGELCLVGTWRNRILSASDVTALYNGGNGLSYAQMA